MARKARQQPHVRLYRHELECEAYRSLSPDARALLVEMRALYRGEENHVFMSVREIRRRLGNVGQKRATQARDDLLERGFIRLLQPGSFTRKARHAAEYALTNEPLTNKDGATAPKDFMKWKKKTVLKTSTDGTQNEYRGHARKGKKHLHGTQNEYRQPAKCTLHGTQSEYTDKLPRSGSFLMAAMRASGKAQFKLILGALLLAEAKP